MADQGQADAQAQSRYGKKKVQKYIFRYVYDDFDYFELIKLRLLKQKNLTEKK